MTDLDKHVNQPGRAKLVKQVRAKINELGIEYIFFQAEDGIRDVERSRGLGDVYKRQVRSPRFRTLASVLVQ